MGEIINNDYIKDCLSANPLCADDIGNVKGSLVKTNFESWEPVPVEPILAYNGFSISNSESKEETLEEVIKRAVKEAIGRVTEEGVLVTPEIEKYHMKHK